MNKSELLHSALLGLAVLIMVGVLAFLYDKTQAVDLQEQNEVFGLLSEVKEIDNRWDFEVQRARIDLGAGEMPVFTRAGAGDKALRSITSVAQHTSSRLLRAGLTDLRKALQAKSELVEAFKAENGITREALQTILKNVAELKKAAATRRPPPAALMQALNQLAESAPQYYLQAPDDRRIALEQTLAQLASVPEGSRELAAQTAVAVQAMLSHIPVEHELFARLGMLTSGPRLLNMTLSFNAELDALLQEKERYRIYLIYYASAMLILLTYLGFKLKASNQRLEHRVTERTRDLSEALRHLKESEAQLIQSEKMSSLGQMVAGIAHEINTPLAYVKNSLGQVSEQLPGIRSTLDHCDKLLELLRTGDDPEAVSREFGQTAAQLEQLGRLHVIEGLDGLVKDGLFGTDQVAEIVINLRNFSRLDRSRVSSFDLNEGLNSTLLIAKHLLKNVTVEKDFGAIPEITCSPSQVNQVFLNLITNAAQAMADAHGVIILTTRSDGAGVAVDVADNGQGIPQEVLGKIFDPFFTTKAIGKGTGLGLSVSYKIVQQHGGRIQVESQPGVGTKFSVWLPLKPPAEAELEG